LRATTVRIPRLRRRWVVVALVAALVFTGYRLLDSATWIYYYRAVDDQTLLVGTISGPGAWVRVTNVTETPATVTITVSNLFSNLAREPPQASPTSRSRSCMTRSAVARSSMAAVACPSSERIARRRPCSRPFVPEGHSRGGGREKAEYRAVVTWARAAACTC